MTSIGETALLGGVDINMIQQDIFRPPPPFAVVIKPSAQMMTAYKTTTTKWKEQYLKLLWQTLE